MYIRISSFFTTNDYPCGSSLFFFNDTAPTEIYTLSLHDALPISASSRLPLQVVGQYGRHELWVHIPLRQAARFEHPCDRRDHLVRLAPGTGLLAQSLQQPVQHVGEPAPRLEGLQPERESVSTHRTSFDRGEEPLRRVGAPRATVSFCKEPAYPPVRKCNSLCQLALARHTELLLCECCHDAVGQTCHPDTHYARQNRREERFRGGGRQDERRVRWRLLQCFQ